MPGPYNPAARKTYDPNNLIWDILAQFYEDSVSTTTPTTMQASNSQSSNTDCQNESDKED